MRYEKRLGNAKRSRSKRSSKEIEKRRWRMVPTVASIMIIVLVGEPLSYLQMPSAHRAKTVEYVSSYSSKSTSGHACLIQPYSSTTSSDACKARKPEGYNGMLDVDLLEFVFSAYVTNFHRARCRTRLSPSRHVYRLVSFRFHETS